MPPPPMKSEKILFFSELNYFVGKN